jgi:hypothetical protein
MQAPHRKQSAAKCSGVLVNIPRKHRTTTHWRDSEDCIIRCLVWHHINQYIRPTNLIDT